MFILDWLTGIGSCFYDATFWLCEFIGCQLDMLYLRWVLSLIYPTIITVFILPFTILFLLYLSAFFLYIYTYRWSRMREVLHESLADPWVGGRYLISLLWDAHGYIWHGYDVQGVENLPENEGGLIVYYHGAIPLDVYYLVARCITRSGRHIHCVGDRFLQKIPGWQLILEAFRVSPHTVNDCVKTVSAGNLLALSPGGVREAQFSDHSYTLLWGNRRGFAKVAIQANCAIIPMFTRNLREAFRVMTFPSCIFEALYSRFKLPFAPLYGGFPVKLVSHLGPKIYPLPGETPDELAVRVEKAVYSLIIEHQRLPGNIVAGLLDRLHPSLGKSLMYRGPPMIPWMKAFSGMMRTEPVESRTSQRSPVRDKSGKQSPEEKYKGEALPVDLCNGKVSNSNLNICRMQEYNESQKGHERNDISRDIDKKLKHLDKVLVDLNTATSQTVALEIFNNAMEEAMNIVKKYEMLAQKSTPKLGLHNEPHKEVLEKVTQAEVNDEARDNKVEEVSKRSNDEDEKNV